MIFGCLTHFANPGGRGQRLSRAYFRSIRRISARSAVWQEKYNLFSKSPATSLSIYGICQFPDEMPESCRLKERALFTWFE
jgi:hypothetical protein